MHADTTSTGIVMRFVQAMSGGDAKTVASLLPFVRPTLAEQTLASPIGNDVRAALVERERAVLTAVAEEVEGEGRKAGRRRL